MKNTIKLKDLAKILGWEKKYTDCNQCKYISPSETEQDLIKTRSPHICKLLNKRVYHAFIHPCLKPLEGCPLIEYNNELEIPIEKLNKLFNKSRLTKEEFHTITCEHMPTVDEESGQAEWCSGELDELWESLTNGRWLYICRDKEIRELKEKVELLEEKLKPRIK